MGYTLEAVKHKYMGITVLQKIASHGQVSSRNPGRVSMSLMLQHSPGFASKQIPQGVRTVYIPHYANIFFLLAQQAVHGQPELSYSTGRAAQRESGMRIGMRLGPPAGAKARTAASGGALAGGGLGRCQPLAAKRGGGDRSLDGDA